MRIVFILFFCLFYYNFLFDILHKIMSAPTSATTTLHSLFHLHIPTLLLFDEKEICHSANDSYHHHKMNQQQLPANQLMSGRPLSMIDANFRVNSNNDDNNNDNEIGSNLQNEFKIKEGVLFESKKKIVKKRKQFGGVKLDFQNKADQRKENQLQRQRRGRWRNFTLEDIEYKALKMNKTKQR